ncbi:MAG: hypothetical protein COA57_13350 [Flavobacteriales bacterium]|nr:MAG: hypothetical protein COA57_13350 [Flavobacteriales bacterium]
MAVAVQAFSQVPPDSIQDCEGAIPICDNFFYQDSAFSGEGAYPNEVTPIVSCLSSGEKNSAWYTFTVQASGQLCFTIIPNNPVDDYDWAVFHMTGGATCDSIAVNSSLEVSCNFFSNGGCNGQTGPNGVTTGVAACDNQTNPCLTVVAGETYYIVINQFTITSNSGYTLDFTQTTATLYDVLPPSLQSVINPVLCSTDTLIVNFSEFVKCGSVELTDFQVTGPSGTHNISSVNGQNCGGGGYDSSFILVFSPPLGPVGNYQINLIGFVEDICGNTNTGPDSMTFAVTPYGLTTDSTSAFCVTPNGTATATPQAGTSPYTYQWNDGQTTPTATGLAAGIYNVTVIDAAGCSGTASVEVTLQSGQQPNPSIVSTTDASCFGSTDGAATLTTSGGTPPYTYSWPSGQTDSTATGLTAGTHTVTVTEANGCNDTISVTINAPSSIPISTSGDTAICIGGTATIMATASGGTGAYTYNWIGGFGSSSSINVTPNSTTTFFVIAADANGCQSDTSSVSVTVFPPISVSIPSVNTLCIGDSLLLTANATGGNSNYSYSWDNGAGMGNPVYVSPASTTTYTVNVSDNCETPPASQSVTVTVGNLPAFQFSADGISGCNPTIINFEIDTIIPNHTYEWDFGDGFSIVANVLSIPHTYTLAGCMDVSLTVTTNLGCSETVTKQCLVEVFPTPQAYFTYAPSNPTNIQPVVNFTDQSTGATSWTWSVEDAISNSQLFSHFFQDTGIFEVQLAAANEYGCADTFVANVFVDYETTIYLPNCFSPNADGFNDEFGPVGEGIQKDDYELYIFNRHGDIIWQTDNLDRWWDGTHEKSGKIVQEGVYVYLLNYKNDNGAENAIRGNIALIK